MHPHNVSSFVASGFFSPDQARYPNNAPLHLAGRTACTLLRGPRLTGHLPHCCCRTLADCCQYRHMSWLDASGCTFPVAHRPSPALLQRRTSLSSFLFHPSLPAFPPPLPTILTATQVFLMLFLRAHADSYYLQHSYLPLANPDNTQPGALWLTCPPPGSLSSDHRRTWMAGLQATNSCE